MSTFHLIADADSNHKLGLLPEGREYLAERFKIFGLTLAVADTSGYNVCPQSTPACRAACVLDNVGNANYPAVKEARKRKTHLLFENPAEFHRLLRLDFAKVDRLAQRDGFTPLFRMDVGSDLGWFRYARDFVDFRFYGYTKVYSRFSKPIPKNMHLTYSWNDLSLQRGVDPGRIFDAGQNVAAVVSTRYKQGKRPSDPLPGIIDLAGYRKRPIDGDLHDWRIPEVDGRGRLIALRFKGSKAAKQEAISSGFCLSV